MEALVPYLPHLMVSALVVLVVAWQIARGHGQELADTALAFLLNEAQATLDKVKREDLDLAVAWLYNAAPASVGPVPWKLFVSLATCQGLAWEAWERAHAFADSATAPALKTAVVKARVARVGR